MREPTTLAERFRFFVPSFAAGPAPLYAHLANCAADELEKQATPLREALVPWEREPFRRFLPLRLLAVVHRWVLAGEVPELAEHYPSACGTRPPEGAWPLFRATVLDRVHALPGLLAPPLQHNEVTRAAALAVGFLLLSREHRMPLRLLEVGASAGLLLRWDRYLQRPWFREMFDGAPPDVSAPVQVSERRGCDLYPVDPMIPAGALRLRSFVWADLVEHLQVLDEAIAMAGDVPVTVGQADGAMWLGWHLRPKAGVVTVLYHSLMRASGPPESLTRMNETLQEFAAMAMPAAPLACLRFEPPELASPTLHGASRLVEVRLTTWPGGQERLLATADVNGRHVRWLL